MSLRPLDPRYVRARRRLHHRYEALTGLPDAARLASLRGPQEHWSEEDVAGLWATAPPSSGALEPQNNVYVHVPFCKSICSFCNSERLRPSNPGWLRAWLDRILQSLETLAPAVSHLEFHTLYVGGGTPSTLPAPMLKELLQALDDRLRWHPHNGRAFEFDPAVMSAARLDVLKAHGFERFSFGIQTLDPSVNKAHRRGSQDLEVVARRFEELAKRGLDQVHCDFLLGLAGTTPQQIFEEMDVVLERFRPAWIDTYYVTPTPSYVEARFSGSYEAFWAHLAPFQELAEAAIERLAERHRYRVTEGHGHRLKLVRPMKKRKRGSFTYNQLVNEQRRPLNLLGLGPSARSQIFGVAALQTRDPGASPDAPGAARYDGHRVTSEDEARTFLVHRLREGDEVSDELFDGCFGQSMEQLAPRATSAWLQDGSAERIPGGLRFTPQDRLSRARSLLWLVPDVWLEHEVARYLGLDLGADGIAALVSPLPRDHGLAGGVRLVRVAPHRIYLRVAGREVSLRVAPPLEEGEPVRLVLDRVPAKLVEPLRPAVRQLTLLVRRNYGRLHTRQPREDSGD